MLSVTECRKYLRNEEELTDEQIEKIRNSFVGLANIVLSDFMMETEKERSKEGKTNFNETLEMLMPEEQEEVIRAAIQIQNEKGISWEKAEREAVSRFIQSKRN